MMAFGYLARIISKQIDPSLYEATRIFSSLPEPTRTSSSLYDMSYRAYFQKVMQSPLSGCLYLVKQDLRGQKAFSEHNPSSIFLRTRN